MNGNAGTRTGQTQISIFSKLVSIRTHCRHSKKKPVKQETRKRPENLEDRLQTSLTLFASVLYKTTITDRGIATLLGFKTDNMVSSVLWLFFKGTAI